MSVPAARTLRPEDQIAHYRIVGPLGAGGMGEVYLAQDRTLERNVALKILPPDLVRSEERVRRFVLEAKSASSLSHPNIVTIYEIGQEAVRSGAGDDSAPVHYISMELISGKTLGTLIHEDRVDLKTLLGYLAQAADGLAKAHAAGIVHRDLKPGNIMVTNDGFAKVLDFGLAKLTETGAGSPDATSAPTVVQDATREGMVVGTAGYMSPEQVQGKGVDHRSDIFAFGCILYEAAARRRPFLAETGVETMHKILHDTPTPIEELNSRVPAELRRLIRRCLQKSPDQRAQSMKDVAIELREVVDEFETLSASASSGTMAGSRMMPAQAARRPSPWPWIGGAVALAAVLAVGYLALGRRAPATSALQDVRIAPATTRGDVVDAALSPDGRYIGYLAGRPGAVSLRVRQVSTGSDVEIVPPTSLQVANPAFSPDGDYLFYTSALADRRNYRALYQVPSLGGRPVERAFDVDSAPSFSPDGKRLVFWRHMAAENDDRLFILDLDSGQERHLATFEDGVNFAGAPAWSPDGKRIAAAQLLSDASLSSRIVMVDPESGHVEEFLTRPGSLFTSVAWQRDGRTLGVSGQILDVAIRAQVQMYSYPGARESRVTNDAFEYSRLSASRADDVFAAIRRTMISNAWLADAETGTAVRLTNTSAPEASLYGVGPLDSTSLVYFAGSGGPALIWMRPAGPGEGHPLTTDASDSFRPLGAGDRIVFDRIDATGIHVWVMKSDGSGQRPLSSGTGEQSQAISPDGRMVGIGAYDRSLPRQIVNVADGSVVGQFPNARALLAFSPDNRLVLGTVLERNAEGLHETRFRVYPVTGGDAVAEPRLPGAATSVLFGPDSKSVGYMDTADPNWNVFLQPVDGGPRVPVTRVTGGRVTAYRWSPDGRRLLYRVQDGEATSLFVMDVSGGDPRRLSGFGSETIFSLQWMPDSRRIAATAGTAGSDVVLIRRAG
jgi:Tol biopolymer transport system component